MKALLRTNRVLLTLLSVMTGVVKLVSMPAEMELFRAAGVPDDATWILGAVQLIGGLLLLPARTTRLGAQVMAPTFAIATLVVFANGMLAFGFASLAFIAMAVLHAWKWPQT